MTLAHAGLGVFVLGAAVETSGRIEAAQALSIGERLKVGAYELTLTGVSTLDGPNYSAERGTVRVVGPHGFIGTMTPERRFYPVNRQATSPGGDQRAGRQRPLYRPWRTARRRQAHLADPRPIGTPGRG